MNRPAKLMIGLLLCLFALVLLWVFHVALTQPPGARLADLALASLPLSGVTNPVTAVLVNYRAYDTLLELAVLLAALLGIWSLGAATPGFQPAGSALAAMVSWVVPLLILTGGYLLWVGGYAPGGAFQAGALLGAAGVLLRLAGDERAGLPSERAQRRLAVAGIAVFALVGLGTMVAGTGFLTYPQRWSKWLILLAETAATVSIGVILAAAYAGGKPRSRASDGATP